MKLLKSILSISILLIASCQQKTHEQSVDTESFYGKLELGELSTIYQLPYAYDHTVIYHQDEGKWHLYGIINDNREFIHLTADSLTQEGWEKHDSFRYKGQEIWAPHIIESDGRYHMFYTSIGVPRQIRYAVSEDLYNWKHPFKEPLFAFKNEHTDNMKNKDPMVFKYKDQWIMYYSMMKDDKHWVVGYSTSKDLIKWSDPKICFDEHTESPGVESPFVVQRGDYFYLTLSARPWPHGAQEFFISKSPFHWESKDLVKSVYPWHAAELVEDLDGQWYMTRSSGDQSDFRIAPLQWNDGLKPVIY
ncbi:hypothetical protein GCM10028791_26240 [Echinicola sediminis]